MNQRRPVRVAIVNDYELVVVGVAALLEPFRDRIHIVELDSSLPVLRDDVDVILYDTFGQVQGKAVDVEKLVNGGKGKVVVYSWNLHQELVADSLEAGVAGYLSKGMDAEELVRAIEQIHAGQTVVPRTGGTANPKPDSDWPGKAQGLTVRESEIVALITQGLSNQEIADRSYLSINSVKTYIRTAYRKMGVERRCAGGAVGDQAWFRARRGAPGDHRGDPSGFVTDQAVHGRRRLAVRVIQPHESWCAMTNRPELMLRLTHVLAGLPPQDPLPLRMCVAFVQIVEARGGSISLAYATSERTMLCATDELSARFEDAQDVVREGPSLDAHRSGEIVASRSGAELRERWPGLVTAVREPPHSVRAVPIRQDSSILGVITVHDGAGAMLSTSDTELQFLADAVGAAIVGDMPAPDDVSRLWTERDRVSQATGMVIAQLGFPAGDALALLRAHAFAQEKSLVEVSRSVVDRELDFSRPNEGGSR